MVAGLFQESISHRSSEKNKDVTLFDYFRGDFSPARAKTLVCRDHTDMFDECWTYEEWNDVVLKECAFLVWCVSSVNVK